METNPQSDPIAQGISDALRNFVDSARTTGTLGVILVGGVILAYMLFTAPRHR